MPASWDSQLALCQPSGNDILPACHCTCRGRGSPCLGSPSGGLMTPVPEGSEGAHSPVCSLALWFARCHPPAEEKGREAWWGCDLGKAVWGRCPSCSPQSPSLLMSFQTWSRPWVHGMRYQNSISCCKTLASYSLFKLISWRVFFNISILKIFFW